jgi:hypothetical protein
VNGDKLSAREAEVLCMHVAKPAVRLLLALLIGICMFAQNENAALQDLKIVTTEEDISGGWQSYVPAPDSKTTVSVHGPRIRYEYTSDDRTGLRLIRNPANPIAHRAILYQCDLRRVLHLVLNEKLYLKVDLDGNGFPSGSKYLNPEELDAMLTKKEQAKAAGTLAKAPATVKIVTDYVDTGERKQMYGFTARRVRISRKVITLPGAQRQPREFESDGWYVDLKVPTQCPTAYDAIYAKHHLRTEAFVSGVYFSHSGKPSRPDTYEIENHGKPENGFPVEVTTTTRDIDDTAHSSTTFRKSIISLEPLDPALFEVPGDFVPGKVSAITGRARPDTLFGDIQDWWYSLTRRISSYWSRPE